MSGQGRQMKMNDELRKAFGVGTCLDPWLCDRALRPARVRKQSTALVSLITVWLGSISDADAEVHLQLVHCEWHFASLAAIVLSFAGTSQLETPHSNSVNDQVIVAMRVHAPDAPGH